MWWHATESLRTVYGGRRRATIAARRGAGAVRRRVRRRVAEPAGAFSTWKPTGRPGRRCWYAGADRVVAGGASPATTGRLCIVHVLTCSTGQRRRARCRCTYADSVAVARRRCGHRRSTTRLLDPPAGGAWQAKTGLRPDFRAPGPAQRSARGRGFRLGTPAIAKLAAVSRDLGVSAGVHAATGRRRGGVTRPAAG